MRLVPLLILALGATGCAHFRQAPPSLHTNSGLATGYVYRGTTLNERPVLQADATLAFAGADGDVLSTTVWANMDLQNRTGDAIFPNGNDFDFTEIDFVLDYARDMGEFAASFGLINYNLPNTGIESTTELYGGVSMPDLPLTPSLTTFIDFDKGDGVYLSLAAGHGFALEERLMLHLGASLGWASDNMAERLYGASSGGLADFKLGALLGYSLTEKSALGVSLAQWFLIDNTIEDSLDDAGVETTPLVLALSYRWAF